MRLRPGVITATQKRFAEAYAATGDPVYAAEKAGYGTPAARARENLANPDVLDEVGLVTQRLRVVGGRVGVDTLIELAEGKAIPPGVRRAAASDLVKFSGVGESATEVRKDPFEMTADELAQEIQRTRMFQAAAERELSERAKPVLENEPDPTIFD